MENEASYGHDGDLSKVRNIVSSFWAENSKTMKCVTWAEAEVEK
jgi:hypothetical protein